jgi:hypothetical protein
LGRGGNHDSAIDGGSCKIIAQGVIGITNAFKNIAPYEWKIKKKKSINFIVNKKINYINTTKNRDEIMIFLGHSFY